MIQLRGLVAARGMAAVDASIGLGEVVAVCGAVEEAVAAFLSVLAGARAPWAGRLQRLGPPARLVLVRGGDELPLAQDGRAALRLYAAACGVTGAAANARIDELVGQAPRRSLHDASGARRNGGAATPRSSAELAALRGFAIDARLWLVAALDGQLRDTDGLIPALLDATRRGGATLVLAARAGDARCGVADQVLTLDGQPTKLGARRRSAGGRPLWRTLLSLIWQQTWQPRRLAVLVALGAVLTLLALQTSLAHEGYWFGAGESMTLGLAARLAAALGGTLAASAAAAVAAVELPSLGARAVYCETALGARPLVGLRLATSALPGFAIALGTLPATVWAWRDGHGLPWCGLSPVLCATLAALVVELVPARRLGQSLAGVAGAFVALAIASRGLLW